MNTKPQPVEPRLFDATSMKHAATIIGVPVREIKRAKRIVPEAFHPSNRVDTRAVAKAIAANPAAPAPVESKEAAELRNIQASYRRREFELKKRKSLFIPKTEVVRDGRRFYRVYKPTMLAIPPAIARKLAQSHEASECEAIIRGEIIKALTYISSGEWWGKKPNAQPRAVVAEQSTGQPATANP